MRISTAILPLLFLAACGAPNGPFLPPDAQVTAPENPYDETADAGAALDAAFARASENGTRVLVNFGGNWCPDCRMLAGMMQIPEFAAYLDAHYEVVKIDVGRFDRNEDVVQRLGFENLDALDGVPTVVIATSDGRVVNAATSAEWTTARERRPQEALDYFHRYAQAAPPAGAHVAATRAD